jgi:hypothetical protein
MRSISGSVYSFAMSRIVARAFHFDCKILCTGCTAQLTGRPLSSVPATAAGYAKMPCGGEDALSIGCVARKSMCVTVMLLLCYCYVTVKLLLSYC